MGARHLAAAGCLVLWAAGLVAAQEETVEIELPAQVVFEGGGLGTGPFDPSRPVVVSFRQALLAPGRVLRLGVRLDEAPSGIRLLFATRNARGGIGRSGCAGESDFVPVFESFPRASSGGAEISWTLERQEASRQAGRQAVRLRWRIESVPALGWETGRAVGAAPAPPSGAGLPVGTRPEGGERETLRRQGGRPPRGLVP